MTSSGPNVLKWSVYEVPLTASGEYQNPYIEVDVTATFTGPTGEMKVVKGFWDGDNHFTARFTPTAEGTWTYITSSTDPGLGGQTGSLNCVAPEGGEHGFLRRDKAYPYHFLWDDGTRYFMFGQTYYEIMLNAMTSDNWKAAIDGTAARSMNKVRFNVYPAWANPNTPYPRSSPFGSNHDILNIDYWRKLDEVVRYMQAQGVVAELIMFVNDSTNQYMFGTRAQDERYVRYINARYAAFPNVIWCLTNEWNYTGKDKDYWNSLGRVMRQEDPWLEEDGSLRLLSIHHQTRIDFQFFHVEWPVHAIIQYGVRNGQKAQADEWTPTTANQAKFRNGDQWGNAGILYNRKHNMPVVNDEYGYIGEPEDRSEPNTPPLSREKHRNIIWGIYTAGGYAAAGDRTTYADGRPYMSANWHDTAEYGDIARLVGFFTTKGIEYWKMSSQNHLCASGVRVYVLAEPGKQYVAYAAAGGWFSLELEDGEYIARRYDPRTGEELDLGKVSGGASVRFDTPINADWVIYLKRT